MIVSAISRPPIEEGPERECELRLGGLDRESNSHLDWSGHALSVGDRIVIEILDQGRSDPPAHVRPRKAADEEEHQKNYLRQMARQLGWQLHERSNPEDLG